MAKNTVKKAIESIASGDVRGLRKNIQEALVSKVRKALDIKEKKIAKGLIEAATKTSLREDYKDLAKVAKNDLARVEKYASSNKKEAANAAKTLVATVKQLISKVPELSLATDVLEHDVETLSKALSSGTFSSQEKKLVDRISKLLSQPLSLDESVSRTS